MERLGMAALPPMPPDLLTSTTFNLDPAEAEFLKVRFAEATRGALLAWLTVNHPFSEAGRIWEHEALHAFPPHLADLVDEARRVHYTATGPAILYNVMMAEAVGSDEVREEYAKYLRDWADEVDEQRVFADWDRERFWGRLSQLNPRIRPATRQFLDSWWQLAEAGKHESEEARQLIKNRELRLKRTRARLTYPDARSTWGIGAGTGRLDFRWGIARRHLNDVATGLEK